MWTLTEKGFFSIVRVKHDPTMVKVRARVKRDLEDLIKKYKPVGVTEIIGPLHDRDYPWRVFMKKEVAAKLFFELMLDLDYTNFKSHIDNVQGRDRELVYAQVWGVLRKLESQDPALRKTAK